MTRRTFIGTGCLAAQAPYKDRQPPPEYHGPGREVPPPAGLSEVRIGFYGPSDPAHPDGGTVWQGASRAIEEANRAGGLTGLPFRLVSRWSDNPWRSGASHVIRLAYDDRVWAIIGGIDGPTTHLAEQVIVKARLALVSPVATDRSVNQAGVPWMFSCSPEDDALAAVLAEALKNERNLTLITATDHDSRAFTAELKKAMGSRGITAGSHIEFEPGRAEQAAERAASASVVVLVAGPVDAARFLKALRATGFSGRIYSTPLVARRDSIRQADGVIFPYSLDRPPEGFDDYAGAYAYDAAKLVIGAIRAAGLNRVGIYDAIRAAFLARNTPTVRLATVRDGRVIILPQPAAR